MAFGENAASQCDLKAEADIVRCCLKSNTVLKRKKRDNSGGECRRTKSRAIARAGGGN
jgi:hypothetical protein